jgi:putative MFS transporter
MRVETFSMTPNVVARLERLPMSSYQRGLFAIIATAFLFDTMDTAALAYMLGTIKGELGLSVAQTGLLASSSLLGMLIGAAAAGILSDKYGRKPAFQFSMIIWGIGSLLCGMSTTYSGLLMARVFLGVGMGMELPIALALVAEFLPTQSRGRYTAILEGFLPIGFIAVGLLVYFLMPLVGWRGIFIALAVPAVFLFVIRRLVPESPRWLEATGRFAAAESGMAAVEASVMRALNRNELPLPSREAISVKPKSGDHWASSMSDLWRKPYAKRTLMLWAVWFLTLLGFYGLTSWIAALLQESGYAVSKSILYTVYMSIAGVPGFIFAAWSLEAWGRKPASIFFLLGSAGSAYLYGKLASNHLPVEQVIAAGLLMQFFLFGMWSVIYTYTPELYPTRSRTTGSGMASSIGRIGSIIGPYGIGLLLPITGQYGAFAVGGFCFLLAALTIMVLGAETRGVPLD